MTLAGFGSVRNQSTRKWVGAVVILFAVVGLYGWVSAIEPDCFYSDKVGLQIRLCGENYVGRAVSTSPWVPLALFLVLVGGITLRLR